jgi:hypothetical protein
MASSYLDFYLMSNLHPKHTGVPFTVWISLKGDVQHDVRIWVSLGPKAITSQMITVAIRPEVRILEGEMDDSDLALLSRWVELNRDVLINHWDGEIECSEDAIAAIRHLKD